MRALLCAAMAALAVLAGPASARPVGDGQLAALSTRLFTLLDAAGRDPVAQERLATAPGMQAILRTRRARRAACSADHTCRA